LGENKKHGKMKQKPTRTRDASEYSFQEGTLGPDIEAHSKQELLQNNPRYPVKQGSASLADNRSNTTLL
jgi:hypothetical protein